MAKKLGFKDFLTVDYAPGMPDEIKKRAKKRKMDSGAGTNAEYSSTYSPEEQIDTIDEGSFDAYAALAKMAGTPKNPDKKGFDAVAHLAKSKAVQKAFKDKKLKKEEAEIDELSMSLKHLTKSGLNKAATKDKDKIKKDLEAMRKRLDKTKKESVEQVDEALTVAQRRQLSRRMKLKRRQIEVGRKRAMKRAADPARLKKRAEKAARNQIFKKLSKGKSRSELTPQRRAEIEKRMEKMKSRIQRMAIKLLPKVRTIDKERRASKSKND